MECKNNEKINHHEDNKSKKRGKQNNLAKKGKTYRDKKRTTALAAMALRWLPSVYYCL